MNQTIQRIKLDFYAYTKREIVAAKQYDDRTRILEIELYDNGQRFVIPEDCMALFAAKTGGSAILRKAMVLDNLIIVTLEQGALARAGLMACEIILLGLKTEYVLSSALFHIRVLQSARAGNALPETLWEERFNVANLYFYAEKQFPSATPVWFFRDSGSFGTVVIQAGNTNQVGYFSHDFYPAVGKPYRIEMDSFGGWSSMTSQNGYVTITLRQGNDAQYIMETLLESTAFNYGTPSISNLVNHEFIVPKYDTKMSVRVEIRTTTATPSINNDAYRFSQSGLRGYQGYYQ